MRRKGVVPQLAAIAIGVVIVLVSLAIGFAVLQSTLNAVSLTGVYNQTFTSIWNMISGALPLIGVVILAAIGTTAIAFLYMALVGGGR
ncbi:MAG: hypothetical protein QXF87_04280 [Thermofilaceae archaeon]